LLDIPFDLSGPHLPVWPFLIVGINGFCRANAG
jgi:hypothetical protein